MQEIIREAKTIEGAIEAALNFLGCSREDAQIEILQEPVKGIFGLTKMAKVNVRCAKNNEIKQSPTPNKSSSEESHTTAELSPDEAKELSEKSEGILNKILITMGIQTKLKTSLEEGSIVHDILCDAEGLLIGKHGQTLAALQYILNKIMHHQMEQKGRFIVDVGGYRQRHKMILEKTAKKIAQKVADTKQEEQLKAMSAFDRRIIHLILKDNPYVTTYSLGEGAFRRVVIAPKESEIS
ncbi:MAG: RNA-binding cell elongation regulator Jag/EloR [candidate division FCPU426 bacterium]